LKRVSHAVDQILLTNDGHCYGPVAGVTG